MRGPTASSEKGQSTIEFALSMVLVVLFIMFFFRLAMFCGIGSFIQYATFMSSRALLSSAQTTQQQDQRAIRTLAVSVARGVGREGSDRWPGVIRGYGNGEVRPKGASVGAGPQFQPRDKSYSWQQGVRYTFRSPLFALPVFNVEGSEFVTFTSESWLGREPTISGCINYLRESTGNVVAVDNGC